MKYLLLQFISAIGVFVVKKKQRYFHLRSNSPFVMESSLKDVSGDSPVNGGSIGMAVGGLRLIEVKVDLSFWLVPITHPFPHQSIPAVSKQEHRSKHTPGTRRKPRLGDRTAMQLHVENPRIEPRWLCKPTLSQSVLHYDIISEEADWSTPHACRIVAQTIATCCNYPPG